MTLAAMVEVLAVRTVDGEMQGPGLLEQLRMSIGSGMGGTTPGAGGERIPLNVGAFTVWEDVSGQIEAQFNGATDIRPSRSPALNLMAWFAVFTAAEARGELTDLQVQVATERVSGWVNRIRNQLAPPRVKELLIACPECGYDRAMVGDDEATAIVIPLDGRMTAECRACGTKWSGTVEIINLARQAGVELDVDAIRDARTPHAEDAATEGIAVVP